MKPQLIQSPYRDTQQVNLSSAELQRLQRRAHCLRAAAFRRVFKGIGRGFSALFQALKDSRERRRAIAELQRLDQRTLRDIGIERSQIPLIVQQLIERRKTDRNPTGAYTLRALRASRTFAAEIDDDERCPPLAA